MLHGPCVRSGQMDGWTDGLMAGEIGWISGRRRLLNAFLGRIWGSGVWGHAGERESFAVEREVMKSGVSSDPLYLSFPRCEKDCFRLYDQDKVCISSDGGDRREKTHGCLHHAYCGIDHGMEVTCLSPSLMFKMCTPDIPVASQPASQRMDRPDPPPIWSAFKTHCSELLWYIPD